MVETGHISHYGFLIWTSSVHNVYKGGGETEVMKTQTDTRRQDGKHGDTQQDTCTKQKQKNKKKLTYKNRQTQTYV